MKIDVSSIQNAYTEVHGLYTGLLNKGISAVLVSVKKDKPGHVKQLHASPRQEAGLDRIRFFIYVDHLVPADDVATVIWHFANNIDPKRDVMLSEHNAQGVSQAGIDGTRKTRALDQFQTLAQYHCHE